MLKHITAELEAVPEAGANIRPFVNEVFTKFPARDIQVNNSGLGANLEPVLPTLSNMIELAILSYRAQTLQPMSDVSLHFVGLDEQLAFRKDLSVKGGFI